MSAASSPSRQSVDHKPIRKRKRPTLSCLSCKHRKTKCDKSQPCSTCVQRKEAETCRYDDGSTPPPTQTFVTQDEFQTLKARVDEMARMGTFCRGPHSNSLSSPSSEFSRSRVTEPTPNGPRAYDKLSNTRAEEFEVAVSNLEDLVDPYEVHGTPQMTTPRSIPRDAATYRRPVRVGQVPHQHSNKWPNITACAVPVEQRSARWARDMAEVVNSIPTHHVLMLTIDHYFKEMKQSRTFIHEGIFRREVEQFESLRASNMWRNIDPAWLALLCSMIWTASHSMALANTLLPEQRMDSQALIQLSSTMFESLETSLACATWIYLPQMRVLAALILGMPAGGIGCHPAFIPGYCKLTSAWMWMDIAAGIVKALHLDRLGPDSKPAVLPDDPMLPPGNNNLGRQIALRIFQATLYTDAFSSCGFSDLQTIPPTVFPLGEAGWHAFLTSSGSYDNTMPSNYYENDLTLPETLTPAPLSVKTEIIWTLFQVRMADHSRKITAALRHASTLAYETALEYDSGLQKDMRDLMELRLNGNLNDEEMLAWSITQSSYNQRILRLHRPFYILSFKDERYRYSQLTVVTAAQTMLTNFRGQVRKNPSRIALRHNKFLIVHQLSAILVLFIQCKLDPASKPTLQPEIEQAYAVLLELGAGKGDLYGLVGNKVLHTIGAMIEVADKTALHAAVSPRASMSQQGPSQPQQFLPGVTSLDNVPLQLDQWTVAQLMPEQTQLDAEYAYESWEAMMLGMGMV
ncbi:hypothetical protein CspeluHIS016_0900370 [Cutaneotrichosporon spelunceum]|uniref:Zn(2)-C6 fungal-type domain-containing protein n=1 Tax=Cutaneotrichosporon spelunceum TaxID=1672016 RepID=A0AAD3TZN2_9TREE|nr:hypothetical protein CspeluHIS016_0900370 [Cutaneotrichosporon spelunceum]